MFYRVSSTALASFTYLLGPSRFLGVVNISIFILSHRLMFHFLYELVYCVCSGLFIRLAVDEIKWKDRTRVAVGGVLLHMKKDILAQQTQAANLQTDTSSIQLGKYSCKIEFFAFFQSFISVLFVVKFFENLDFVNILQNC